MPSASARAKEFGGSPSDYTKLFTVHPHCQIDKRNRETSELIKSKNAGDLKQMPDKVLKDENGLRRDQGFPEFYLTPEQKGLGNQKVIPRQRGPQLVTGAVRCKKCDAPMTGEGDGKYTCDSCHSKMGADVSPDYSEAHAEVKSEPTDFADSTEPTVTPEHFAANGDEADEEIPIGGLDFIASLVTEKVAYLPDNEDDYNDLQEEQRSQPSSDAEWDAASAAEKGHNEPESAWILSDRDVWYKNPAYQGPPVPHPEDNDQSGTPDGLPAGHAWYEDNGSPDDMHVWTCPCGAVYGEQEGQEPIFMPGEPGGCTEGQLRKDEGKEIAEDDQSDIPF